MAVSFGPLETCGPTARKFEAAEFATKRIQAITGASEVRLYGSLAFDATMQLTFKLNEADKNAFYACYYAAYGMYKALEIPETFFAGESSVLDKVDFSDFPDYLRWRWAAKPSHETLRPDLHRLQANFIATLDIRS